MTRVNAIDNGCRHRIDVRAGADTPSQCRRRRRRGEAAHEGRDRIGADAILPREPGREIRTPGQRRPRVELRRMGLDRRPDIRRLKRRIGLQTLRRCSEAAGRRAVELVVQRVPQARHVCNLERGPSGQGSPIPVTTDEEQAFVSNVQDHAVGRRDEAPGRPVPGGDGTVVPGPVTGTTRRDQVTVADGGTFRRRRAVPVQHGSLHQDVQRVQRLVVGHLLLGLRLHDIGHGKARGRHWMSPFAWWKIRRPPLSRCPARNAARPDGHAERRPREPSRNRPWHQPPDRGLVARWWRSCV